MKSNSGRSKPRLIISTYDNIRNPFYQGGGARVLNELAQQLSSHYSILILTANYPGSKNFRSGQVRYKHIGPRAFGPKLGQLLLHFLLPFYARTQKYDLWIESFTPPFSTSCLQLFTRKPVLGLAHMLASEDMWRKYKLPFHIIERLGLRSYKFIITLTQNECDKIRKYNKKATVFTIPNGVSQLVKKTKLAQKHTQPYILFLGRIEYQQKGLDLLLKAYESIASETNARLIIAGSGVKRDMQKLFSAVQKSPYKDRIELVGTVGGQTKAQLLSQCQLVVQTSRYETYSLVALEALVQGRPLVGFDIDGSKWIPDNCILRARAFDTQQFGQLMLKALRDERIQKRMSRDGKLWVKGLSWPLVAKQYKTALSHIMMRPI